MVQDTLIGSHYVIYQTALLQSCRSFQLLQTFLSSISRMI